VVSCGIGYSELKFGGSVYNPTRLEDFYGAGFRAADAVRLVAGKGGVRMKNSRRVAIHPGGNSDSAASGFGAEND